MKKTHLLVAAGLGFAQLPLLGMAALAQEKSNTTTDTVRQLNPVVITATRSPKKISEIGRVVRLISAADISRAQGKTLASLLNTVPGITFSGAGNNIGISSALYLRGASVGNTLILVDGFPVNNASSIDGAYDINAFPVDEIDHVEILEGSASTLYGSDAVAGVINIITKHAHYNGLKADVQLNGGSFDTFKESVGLNGKLNKTGIAINVSNTDSRGFAAASDTLGNQNFKKDAFHQRSVSAYLTHAVSNRLILNGNFEASKNTGDLPYGTFTTDNNYTYNNSFLFGGIGAKIRLDKGSILVNISQNTVWNNFTNLPPDNDSTHQVTKNIGAISNAETVLNYNLNQFIDFTSGLGYKYSNTSQYSLFEEAYYHPAASIILPGDAHNRIMSAFTSLFFKCGVFHTELGGRYNNDYKYGHNFTYTFNPSVLIAKEFKVFATIASAFKEPSLYQLYSQYANPGGSLKPETTTSYEAGFDWEILKSLSLNTVFYRRKTTDVIYFYTDPNTYASYYANGDLENDRGMETQLKLNFEKLNASMYYAYVTGTQTAVGGLETNSLLRRPKSTFGLSATYPVYKSLLFGLNYKFVGDRSDVEFLNYAPYSTTVGLPHYSLVDAHIQANATNKLSIYLDINNVFNKKYVDWLGYNTAGFNTMAGIKYLIN